MTDTTIVKAQRVVDAAQDVASRLRQLDDLERLLQETDGQRNEADRQLTRERQVLQRAIEDLTGLGPFDAPIPRIITPTP